MKIRFIDKLTDEKVSNEIWNILCECDSEFYPPLSSREYTFGDIKNNLVQEQVKPYKYFEKLKKQVFWIALNEKEEVMGFMAIIHEYSGDELKDYSPSIYITTICVSHQFRRHGIALELYTCFINNMPDTFRLPYITTRTWSTNTYHMNLLKKIGFDIVLELKNHRGEGVHTYYYAKKLTG